MKSAMLSMMVVPALLLMGCDATMPKMGGGGTVATGAAGGATSEGANSQMEHCDASMGTLSVVEDQNAEWYRQLAGYQLGSTVPVLRMLIQQSNCFVVVERGAAMNNMMAERALDKTGEMRKGSHFQKGQIAAADFTMSPTINFSAKGTEGGRIGAGVGGWLGAVVGSVGVKSNEASTTLLLIDNRSGVQLSAAEGSAKNTDISVLGGAFSSGMAAGGGGYSNTPQGKIIVAAFADSYNQMVKAVRNYEAQTVKGGLGTGGTLGVQGGQTQSSKDLKKKKLH